MLVPMMDDPASFEALVGQLCGFAHSERDKLVIGFTRPDGEPELRVAPPQVTAGIGNAQLCSLIESIDTLAPEGTKKIGIAFPASMRETEIIAQPPSGEQGSAICVAGAMPGGVGSVGLFRPPGSDEWAEAHAELDWLCESMRRFIGGDGIESTEAETFTVHG